tara:strand:- start:143 stop:340 length:198 start_codon:yes stop_codon:yes gene_type:complete
MYLTALSNFAEHKIHQPATSKTAVYLGISCVPDVPAWAFSAMDRIIQKTTIQYQFDAFIRDTFSQ